MYWVRSSWRITSTYALSFNSCFKKTQNTLWRQSQVMKCGFTGLTQHSNTSSLKYQSMFAVSFHIYGVVYLWMCFTGSNCKPPLLHWHLIAPVGKRQVEMTWLHGLTEYWFLHYDNTPAHYALSVHKIMAKKLLLFHTLPTHHVVCLFFFSQNSLSH